MVVHYGSRSTLLSFSCMPFYYIYALWLIGLGILETYSDYTDNVGIDC